MGKLINVVYEKFSVIPKEVFMDRRLDYRSRGVLCTLISLPNGWNFSVRALLDIVTPTDDEGAKLQQWKNEGRDAITSCLQKLEKLGYVKRLPAKNEKGQFTGYDYEINIPPIPMDMDARYCD